MFVRKAFQFRLRPTKAQAKLLQAQLDECRWLYNELLSQRKIAYEELDMSLSKYQQLMFLPILKEERPSLKMVHSQVLQNIVDRLDKSFQAFFRRCKAEEKAGFPRFRGIHRYDSFCYPQSGFLLIGKEISLSKVGSIRIKMHRPIEGEIKTCTIKKTASGAWDVTFSCEARTVALESKTEAIAIDVGIESFATLSSGKKITNPRFFKKGEKALAKAQRKLSKLQKGSKERRKTGKAVAKIHERIKNQRKDFCHKQSRKIVDEYQYICIEDLNVKKLIEGSHFAKSIADVSWNQFRQFLTYKAAEAGRKLGLVNPAYTSQVCSQCGHLERKKLAEREHKCSRCGYTADRDLNAARNILALGLDGLGEIPRSLRL
ncbi:MAG: transposase [Parachlamydiales bacterium]|nr:transposase [Parachlamydiales bacterium]